jgi:ATP-dependent DNA helicase DinG
MAYRPVLVAFDLETTGLSPDQDEIIELGAVKIEEGRITEKFQALVRPRQPIPKKIIRLTGITQEMLDQAPSLEKVLPNFMDFLDNHPLIAHQASFDMGFLESNLGYRLTNQVLDTVELARLAFPRVFNHKLITLARELDLTLAVSHRALEDAATTAELFLAIDKVLKGWELGLIHRMNELAATFPWSLGDYFQYIEKHILKNSFELPKRSGFNYLVPVTRAAEGIFAQEKELCKKESLEYRPVELEFIKLLLRSDGAIAGSFDSYEFRSQQLEMLCQVAESLNQEQHLLVEAGTGTGKSLAYLLPAIVMAVANQDKVVVSTYTITLQEQLWLKDIPQLRLALKSAEERLIQQLDINIPIGIANFRTALVKGRSNYLCLRKWSNIEQIPDPYTVDEKKFFLRLFSWLSQTSTGDRSELNLHQQVLEAWQLVAADSESCLSVKCPWYNHWCFVMRARRQCEDAHLLVVNHSLLFSDLKTQNQVLPEYERLIIDEAHHLEDVATEHLGVQISYQGLISLGNGLFRTSRHGPTGLLVNLKNRWNRLKWQNSALNLEPGERSIEDLIRVLPAIKEQADIFFGIITGIAGRDVSEFGMHGRSSYRFSQECLTSSWWEGWMETRDNLIFHLNSMQTILGSLGEVIENLEAETGSWLGEKKDLEARRQYYFQFLEGLQFITAFKEENWVYWVETEQRNENYNCLLRAAPIEVAELLNRYLFEPKKTVILTSATLAVGNSFKHIIKRIGLNQLPADRLRILQLESPFIYEEQALLCVIRDIPNPVEVGDKLFIEAITTVLEEILVITQGRAMVLFTSHHMLRETYARIKPAMDTREINLLGHNIDGGHSRLMEEFRTTPRSVIFGASTFWEGVDIRGEELSCVIIVKLPFQSPNQPIVAARLEAIAKNKGNGFYNYTLPEAILRLKQGFGRLIRSKSDRGIVIILDNRIIDKTYGQAFFKSLPLQTHLRENLNSLKDKINYWLN